jgi:predicted dehydrogenase
MAMSQAPDVLIVGGGMICFDCIFPTVFQEQRFGRVGEVILSTLRGEFVTRAREHEVCKGKKLVGFPDPAKHPPDQDFPDMYKEAIALLSAGGIVIVATPDHFHTPVVTEAIEHGHHCIVMKPLCLKIDEARKVRDLARARGMFVATDYHKRHDRSVRAAKHYYRRGILGEALHGHAWIEERREIPTKWFAAWCHKSSPFEYIGVHYADAWYYITGLLPKRLLAWGQKKWLPAHGHPDAFDAVQACVEWENGSVLFIRTAWIGPMQQTTLTNQGMSVYCTEGEYWADHKDRHTDFCTTARGYEHYNPNFMKPYCDWEDLDEDLWVGYGYDSIAYAIADIAALNRQTEGLGEAAALKKRQQILAGWEQTRALPNQALVGVAINEAVRLSIDNDSRYVSFDKDLNISL